MEGMIVRKRDLLKPLQRGQPVNPEARVRRRRRINTILALGLWGLLWGGYNTDNSYVRSPGFPESLTIFIHGVRAFFPILAGWIALLVILARARSAVRWIMGPLGLFLLYALIGAVSSLALSIDPIDAAYWAANYLSIVLVLLAIVSAEDALPDISKLLTFNWIVSAISRVPSSGSFLLWVEE